MFLYTYLSLSTLRTPERAAAWLADAGHHQYRWIKPNQNIAFSLDAAINDVSRHPAFHPGPAFIVRARVGPVERQLLCRGQKVHGDMIYLCTIDALRVVRINQEIIV